ncbi:MAG TPA: GNAT family N-acyltransferase [Chthoniobacterales bacterium]|jgi:putative hemolysin
MKTLAAPRYATRLATTHREVEAALRLRYEVFNLELNEGLESSHATGQDEDAFDPVCDHLLVTDETTGAVVGTYRMQTGPMARQHLGYYSEQEFDFAPYEPIRPELVELGRACVHRDHRTLRVVSLLWRGIADYAAAHHARYLIGCSSLTSQDAALGHATFHQLAKSHLAAPDLRTTPLPEYTLPPAEPPPACPAPPKLLRAYLSLGAKICGPPAIDRAFRTIDFLTLMDCRALPAIVTEHFRPA